MGDYFEEVKYKNIKITQRGSLKVILGVMLMMTMSEMKKLKFLTKKEEVKLPTYNMKM